METFGRRVRALKALTAVVTMLASMLVVLGVYATPAHAVTTCGPWHRITWGEGGLNLVVTNRSDYIMHYGQPNVEPWNQLLQFCHDPIWTSTHYAIRSNGNGYYWTTDTNSTYVCACSLKVYNEHELFEILDYDGNFYTIAGVGKAGYLTGRGSIYIRRESNNTIPLNGGNLFLISPRDLRYW
jgi:hypothetical protein